MSFLDLMTFLSPFRCSNVHLKNRLRCHRGPVHHVDGHADEGPAAARAAAGMVGTSKRENIGEDWLSKVMFPWVFKFVSIFFCKIDLEVSFLNHLFRCQIVLCLSPNC